MTSELDAQMERLQRARDRVDSLGREQSKIQGSIERLREQIGEMEAKAVKEFGCGIDSLPALVESLKEQIETNLKLAEDILEGKATVQVKAPVATPVTPIVQSGKTAKPAAPVAKTVKVTEDEDDSLF